MAEIPFLRVRAGICLLNNICITGRQRKSRCKIRDLVGIVIILLKDPIYPKVRRTVRNKDRPPFLEVSTRRRIL